MKELTLSILASTLMLSTSSFAHANLTSGLSEDHTFEKVSDKEQGIYLVDGWIFLGDIRAGLVQYDYGNPPKGIVNGSILPTDPNINKGHIDSKGFYVMPKLSIMSPKENRIKAKATIAGATDFGINDEKYEARNYVFDPNNRESFALLHEAYIAYDDGDHRFLVGREELTTPMIDSDDWYMLANSFELTYYKNSSLENMTFNLGYFSKMASGIVEQMVQSFIVWQLLLL